MTTTHTKTYNTIEFADPFKECLFCHEWVDGVTCVDRGAWPNIPCGHIGYKDLCPSWGPVDGCSCAEYLGHVPHRIRAHQRSDLTG